MLNIHSANQNTNQEVELFGLAALLNHRHLIDTETVKNAVQQAKQQNISFASYLVKMKMISSEALLKCCMDHCALPVFDLSHYDFSWLNSVINSEMICRYHIVPLAMEKNFLQIGMSDPTDQDILSAISFHAGLPIRPVLIDETQLTQFIATYCKPKILYAQLETAISKISSIEKKDQTLEKIDKNNEKEDEPISKFVDHLIIDAIEKNISDIHIEPYANHCRIRYRSDGLLYEAASTPLLLATRTITRLKIMANLNIAEKRLPQDGHIPFNREKKVDIRISTCPTIHGEKIVLRLLDIEKMNLEITALGLTNLQEKLFLQKISRPQGLILVTGPTGSGKTMTLYAALRYLNTIEKNISTVEDPVEIQLPGVCQISINPRIGLDFAGILRNLLRQDPDIIMIGEIRDKETASIALQASETGHLVLATLHTNSAVEAIPRLQSLGVTLHHLINSISLIVAQRLVRKLCPICNLDEATPRQKISTDPKNIVNQCQYCHSGYQGRIGIFECLTITDMIAKLISTENNIFQINECLMKSGWISLWKAGLMKVNEKVTNFSELVRVLGNKNEDEN